MLWVGKEDVSASWVQESSLSPTVIEEFDRQIETEVCIEKSSTSGQLSYTATIKEKDLTGMPKRAKTDRWISQNTCTR